MTYNRPKMCILSASPLTIQSFLMGHILELSNYFDIVIIYNPKYDGRLDLFNISVRQIYIPIERKVSLIVDLKTLAILLYKFKIEKFDIVISLVPKAGFLGMLAALIMRVPKRVHIFQGEIWSSRRGLMRLFFKTIDFFTSRFSSHLLAVSKSILSFLEQERVVPKGKAKVLGYGSICGVDLDRFKPNPQMSIIVRNSLNIPNDAVVCIFLGRLTADKGIYDLVQAFTLAANLKPNLYLLLVGSDEEHLVYKIIDNISSNIKRRIFFLGFCRYPENLLAASDFLCLPSYREGFGMVILEAAAMGLPSIGTRIHGISDAIDDGLTGSLLPVGDVGALADEIVLWSEWPIMRAEFSKAGLDKVLLFFDKKFVVRLYVDYFLELFAIKNSNN